MSRREANTRVLDFLSDSGESSVDFFFYADRQDDASNLAIELNKMGYQIDAVDQSPRDKKWSVIGRTPLIKMDVDSITKWTDKMDTLALENNCEFDGWGTMTDKVKL